MVVASHIMSTSILKVASVLEQAENAVDPVMKAMTPALVHAGSVMETAAHSGEAVARLIDHTVVAADQSIPAIQNAAAVLNSSTMLVARLSRLVSHPTIKVDVIPAAE